MIVTEILSDKPVGGTKLVDDANTFIVTKKIGDREIVFQCRKSENVWDVFFLEVKNDNASFDATGSGDEIKVFSFVINSFRAFVEKRKPEVIEFTAKTDDKSRSKLYQRMLDRFAGDEYVVAKKSNVGTVVKNDVFTLVRKVNEGMMKRSDPYVSGAVTTPVPKTDGKPTRTPKPIDKRPKCGVMTRAQNIAKKAGVSTDKVMSIYNHAKTQNTSYAAVWSYVQKQLNLSEEVMDADEDDYDDGVYEREKKVSLLILRAFRKCGLTVAESDASYAPRDRHDYTGYDVIYSEDDGEATVTLEEAELGGLTKLHSSGLIDGECSVAGTRDGFIRLTFKIHGVLKSGHASIED